MIPTKMQTFKLTATGYNLNYLPEYIALRHGFFREQGLDVTVNIPTPWDGVLDALADGSADMALGGIWVPTMYRDRVQNYTAFAQIANRCPLAILRRSGCDKFRLSDVAGKTVLMKSGGGASVGLFFKMLLRENNIDARSVDYIQDLDGTMLSDLFQGGMGDYFVTDYLSARVIASRNADVTIALEAVTQGEVPWSVYYRETATITPGVLDAQRRFCIALGKAIDWVLERDAETFREELAELFPAVPVDVTIAVTNRFRQEGMWASTTISRKAFDRWQRGLTDARLVREPIAYEALVDDEPSTIAEKQRATSGASLLPASCGTNGAELSGAKGSAIAVK